MGTISAIIEAERGRFSLLLPIAMGAAILVYFNLKSEPPLWLGVSFTAASLAALAIGWRYPPTRFAAALTLAAALGFARAEFRTAAMPPLLDVPFGAVALTGSISSIDTLPTGRRLTITQAQFQTGPPLVRALHIKLSTRDTTALTPGDTITLRAILFKPERPAYPGGWDSTRDAYFAGLGASGFAIGPVCVTTSSKPGGMALCVRGLREVIAANIMDVLPPETGSIAVTLLTGLQTQIPAEEHQNFIAAGLAHLLAVAGLHVGIVMGLFFTASRFLLSRPERLALRLPVKPAAAIIALLAGGAYALLTGAHLPILRSLAMASLVTVGVIAGRKALSLRGLALAAAALLLATPEAIIGVSFQMSFSAVLALIAGYSAISNWVGPLAEGTSHARRVTVHLAGLFTTSLLAGGASMPFAAYQFQQVQPYWILANLVAVPLTALWIMPLGLLALALMPLGLGWLAIIPMGWGIAIVVRLTSIIATWPDAMLRVPPMPGLAILLFTGGLAWLCIWRSRSRLVGLIPIAAALVVYLAARPPDVLISADAKLIAIQTPAGLLLQRQPKASSYTLTQWQALWPGQSFTPLDTTNCPDNICNFATKISVALILTAPGICPNAPLIISPLMLRGACNAPERKIIDRLSTYQNGATAIWLTGPHIETDRDDQGARPWVPAWPE
ncbi:MAG: hypothetical protein B7W99_02950 [Rhodospirillales bacterium 20-58-10]|nr:MAG: hypothetical protein B7W99_02950 [Rhodospirillales bacterium 20-58-10]